MDIESEVIQQQMEETRTSLQDKLETLEQQVKDTVQDATEALSDTVESVKEAVQDTVDTVKGTVEGTVQSVKATFDLSQKVKAHPWAMFMGATAVGFMTAQWLNRHRAAAPALDLQPGGSVAPPAINNGTAVPSNGNSPRTSMPAGSPSPQQRKASWVADHFREERSKLKGLAMGTMGGLVRELLTSSAPPALAERIKEVVNGITVKMGGQLIESPILSSSTPQRTPTKSSC